MSHFETHSHFDMCQSHCIYGPVLPCPIPGETRWGPQSGRHGDHRRRWVKNGWMKVILQLVEIIHEINWNQFMVLCNTCVSELASNLHASYVISGRCESWTVADRRGCRQREGFGSGLFQTKSAVQHSATFSELIHFFENIKSQVGFLMIVDVLDTEFCHWILKLDSWW